MALNETTAEQLIDISNGKSSITYTTPNEIKNWTLDNLVLDKYPRSLAFIDNTLIQTLADNSTLTVDLSSLSDTFTDTSVSSGIYNLETESITLTKSDASTVSVDVSAIKKWYAIGSSLDVVGEFDQKYTDTASLLIPSNKGNVMLMLNLDSPPTLLLLPAIASVPIGWECNILTYGTTPSIVLNSDTPNTIFNDLTDPFTQLTVSANPYSSLTTTVNLETGHFYKFKKVNSAFFLGYYA